MNWKNDMFCTGWVPGFLRLAVWSAPTLLVILIVAVLLMGPCGCTITTRNDSTVGIRWGTEIAAFHHTAKTSDEDSESKVEVPALTELLIPKPEVKPETKTADEALTPPSNP